MLVSDVYALNNCTFDRGGYAFEANCCDTLINPNGSSDEILQRPVAVILVIAALLSVVISVVMLMRKRRVRRSKIPAFQISISVGGKCLCVCAIKLQHLR